MSARRILVVEDDPSLRETLADVLRDDGHDVHVAADGEAALSAVDEWGPELIVLDLMMPRMDGFAFREAQRDRAGSRAPAKVLLLSAAHGVEAAAEELEADAWLVKPFGLRDVLASVDRLLRNGSDPGPTA